MKAQGHILMPVHSEDNKLIHYESRLTAEMGERVYEHSYITEVDIFNNLAGQQKIDYTQWLESYLKRAVARLMLNEGVVFTYK